MKPNDKDSEILTRVYNKYKKSLEVLEPLRERANENARYLRAVHWTDAEVQQHTLEGYTAYNIPLLATKINRVLAIQRTNRFSAKCYGRAPEDEIGAEVKNYILDYIHDYNKFKYPESDIYRDGLAKIFGVLCIEPDYHINPEGEISMKREQWNCFFWDTNAKDYELDTASFMGTEKWHPIDDVIEEYPGNDWNKEELEQYYDDSYGSRTDWCDAKKKEVKVVRFFEYQWETRYLCKNIVTGDFDVYESQEDAEAGMQEKALQALTQLAEAQEVNLNVAVQDFEVIKTKRKQWYKIVFSGKTLLEHTKWKYSKPPFFRYACFEDDGHVWSLTDLAKDPQKLFDRMSTMIDKSTAKNIKGNNYQAVLPDLHPSVQNDLDNLMRGLSAGGFIVPVTRRDAITPLDRHNQIQVEATLADKYQMLIEDILGGRTFQGLETTGAQTATEVSISENNAKQVTSLYLDNLARWKYAYTQYLVELIDDIFTRPRQFRIMGEIRTQEVTLAMQQAGVYEDSKLAGAQYGYVDTGKLPKAISEYNVDLEIDDVTATTLDRQNKFQQILAINEIAVKVYGQPLPFEFIVRYANLDPSVKAGLQKFQALAEQNRKQLQNTAQASQKVMALSQLANTFKPGQPAETKGTPTANAQPSQTMPQ